MLCTRRFYTARFQDTFLERATDRGQCYPAEYVALAHVRSPLAHAPSAYISQAEFLSGDSDTADSGKDSSGLGAARR